METRPPVFFQAVLKAISRFHSTEENFQKSNSSKNAGKLLWALFEVHTLFLLERSKSIQWKLHQKSHLKSVLLHKYVKTMGEILQVNQMVYSPDQPWTIPSNLPTPQCPKYPNSLEIKLLKSGLSNIILLARE